MTIRKVGGYGAGLGGNTFTGAQVAPSLALGGATIGSNALAVTGTAAVSTSLATPIVTSISGSLSVGGAQGTYLSAQGNTKYFAVDNWVAGGSLGGRASSVIGFTSQATDPDASAPDTAFSRISAGIIGVGTGAAGNVAGGLQAATLALGGATIGTNALAVTGTAFVSGNVAVAGSTFDPFGRGYTNMLSVGSINSGTSAIEINAGAAFNAFLDLGVNGVRVAALVGNATNASFVTAATGTSIIIGVNSQNDLTIANGGIAAIRGTLAIGGATIGSNALAVTGTAAISGATVISATGTALQLSTTTPTLQIGSTNNLQIIYDGTTNDAATFRLSRDGANSDFIFRNSANIMARAQRVGSSGAAQFRLSEAVATPAGGTAGLGYTFGSTTNFGVFFGSGAPTLSAAKGSLYLRSDGTGVADRMYVNTDASTTWTAVATVA